MRAWAIQLIFVDTFDEKMGVYGDLIFVSQRQHEKKERKQERRESLNNLLSKVIIKLGWAESDN